MKKNRNLVLRIIWCLLLMIPVVLAEGSSVNLSEEVDIGGIKQWITASGTDDRNPVLLFLHGGPGNSVMSYADNFTGELKKHFVVVQWDQRESGKTAKLNTSLEPLTVALMEQDAIEMINYLRMRFSQEKIYLVGHSWGGFLGLLVATNHPELLKAYVAVSPMVNQLESERLSLQWMIEKAKETNNQQATGQLAKVHIPFQDGDQLYYHRSWLYKLMGNKFPSKDFVVTWAKKWLPLFNEASAVNFFKVSPEIKCPVYFFVGRKDYQTHFTLTEKYANDLKADKKELFWFENSGHNLNTKEPRRFQEIIINEILPTSGR